MKAIQLNRDMRCDMGSCTKTTRFAVDPDTGDPGRRLYLCPDCLKKLHAILDKEIKLAKKARAIKYTKKGGKRS